jgi:DNA-directed RNA polymerase subunit RPC12/RpoP
MADDEFEGWCEDEEYRCSKCGKPFYLRTQETGKIDFDERTGSCEICGEYLCEKCGNWHKYGDKYNKICKNCFDSEMLYDFEDWYENFENEYCNHQCDDCPFFSKRSCMMIFLHELVEEAFHTKELKEIERQRELKRIQRRNDAAIKEWTKQLRELGSHPIER